MSTPTMLISLTVQQGDDSADRQTGTYHYQFDQDEVLVGRDRATEVRLPHPAVSLVHLRLLRKRGRVWVIDMGSRNGTYLDGLRLEPHRGAVLDEGGRLEVGPFVIVFGPPRNARRELTAPADTARLAREMVLEFLGPGTGIHPFLEVDNSAEQGQRLALPALGGARVVGRGESCNLRLSDADASRRHFEVQNKGEVVELRDLGSKNGVERNGARVTGVVELRDGDCLRVGHTRLRFNDPAEQMLGGLAEGEGDAEQSSGVEQGAGPSAEAPEEREPQPGAGAPPEPGGPSEDSGALQIPGADAAPAPLAPGVEPPAAGAPELPGELDRLPRRPVGNLLLTFFAVLIVLGAVAGVVYLLAGGS